MAALRLLAAGLKEECPEIVAVRLFGSFATGTPTPRSDADVVVEVSTAEPLEQESIRERAEACFLAAPVPVDLFVVTSARLAAGGGVAGAAARKGVPLAD